MKLNLLAAVAAVSLGLAGMAQAREIPAGGLSTDEVGAWLRDAGYKAELKTNDSGKPYYRTSADGVGFDVDFYDCKNGRCASIQFNAGFDTDGLSTDKINAWNAANRYIRAYVADDGDPWFCYDANLSPGGTYEALDDDFAVWIGFLPNIKEHIGWK